MVEQSLQPPVTGSDTVTAQLVLDCKCELGEGVVYDDRTRSVLWTDILGKTFHRLRLSLSTPADKDSNSLEFEHDTYKLPKKLGSFGMLLDSPKDSVSAKISLPLLCAFEDCFQLYDVIKQMPLSPVSVGEDVNPAKGLTRLNDGRVDQQGIRFIAGGYYGDNKEGITMKVFRCQQQPDKTLCHSPLMNNIQVANSTCFSQNGDEMYFADSPTQQIHKFRYDSETGALTGKQLVSNLKIDAFSVPDGSCVDSEGFIWNAVWRTGQANGMIRRVDPTTGRVVFTVHMPDRTSQVTCCCFGGPDLDTLFITTAAESTDPLKEPHAGGLYAVRLPFRGRPEARLRFQL